MYHFVSFPLCRLTTLSTHHFVDSPLCQLTTLSTYYFVNLLLCRLTTLSTYYFVDLLLCQLTTLLTFHFVNLPFSQLAIYSTCHFLNLPFSQLTFFYFSLWWHTMLTTHTQLLWIRVWELSEELFWWKSRALIMPSQVIWIIGSFVVDKMVGETASWRNVLAPMSNQWSRYR